MGRKIQVLVVDDSALCRELIADALSRDDEIEVVGQAADGEEAVAKALALKPNVITMDVEMPVLDGLGATERIMRDSPVAILMLTADPKNQEPHLTRRALTVGALALQIKPELDAGPDAWNLAREVKLLSTVKVLRPVKVAPKPPQPAPVVPLPAFTGSSPVGLVVVAASTGGPQVLHKFLSELPEDFPAPIVVVQHISPAFAGSLVEWMQSATKLKVQVAKEGDLLTPGVVLIGATAAHVTIPSRGRISVTAGDPKAGYLPSATLLMESAAQAYGKRCLGVILTGMGHDGAEGMLAIRNAGGRTIAQSQDSCMVFGMPGAAIAKGAVEQIVHADQLASAVLQHARE